MSDSKFKLEFSEKLDKVIFETGNASLYIETKPSSSVTMKDLFYHQLLLLGDMIIILKQNILQRTKSMN